jgi:uncharacterized protein
MTTRRSDFPQGLLDLLIRKVAAFLSVQFFRQVHRQRRSPGYLSIVLCLVAATAASAQDFDFPRSAVLDSEMLEKAIPVLAMRVSASYKDEDRIRYLDNIFRLQIVDGKYEDALVTIASLRELIKTQTVIPSRASWVNVQYEIYARAKILEAGEKLSFKDAYTRAFHKRFAELDDWSAAQVIRAFAYSDPADKQHQLLSDIEKQKNKETIGLTDALRLVNDYLVSKAYHDFTPLNSALIKEDDERRYVTETDLLVKTPDGASICTFVMRPRAATNGVPALLLFSIYVRTNEAIEAETRMSAANGYAGVAGFTRGKACSPDKPAAYLYDGEDAAALIGWISARSWSDGRVGMYGGSYLGFTQWAAAKRLPKALKAMMPTAAAAPGVDVPMEGHVFWNFVYPWPFYTLDKKTNDDATYNDAERWQKLNRNWYLSGRAYRDLDKIDGTPNPTFDQWIAHPDYDAYWQGMIPYQDEFARVTIPVLLTAGYYYGGPGAAVYYFSQLEKFAPQSEHYLLIGPYHHFGAQVGVIGIQGNLIESLAGMPIDPVAEIDVTELRYQWFNYVFKGAPKPALLRDKVNYEVTGADRWKHAPSLAAMGNSSMRFYLGPARPGGAHRLSPDPSEGVAAELKVNLADRSDVDRTAAGGGVMDDAVDTHNALEFVSDPLPRAVEMSGLFSGHVDFIANKKDFDFEIDTYELTPQGKYVQLSEYWTRASYINDHTHRKLLEPGKRQQFDFTSVRLMSRQLQQGSCVVVVIRVIKEPGRQINYGTGRDVSDETIQDAAVPLDIRWLGDSTLLLPSSR